jgi:hypothetical protein
MQVLELITYIVKIAFRLKNILVMTIELKKHIRVVLIVIVVVFKAWIDKHFAKITKHLININSAIFLKSKRSNLFNVFLA